MYGHETVGATGVIVHVLNWHYGFDGHEEPDYVSQNAGIATIEDEGRTVKGYAIVGAIILLDYVDLHNLLPKAVELLTVKPEFGPTQAP